MPADPRVMLEAMLPIDAEPDDARYPRRDRSYGPAEAIRNRERSFGLPHPRDRAGAPGTLYRAKPGRSSRARVRSRPVTGQRRHPGHDKAHSLARTALLAFRPRQATAGPLAFIQATQPRATTRVRRGTWLRQGLRRALTAGGGTESGSGAQMPTRAALPGGRGATPAPEGG